MQHRYSGVVRTFSLPVVVQMAIVLAAALLSRASDAQEVRSEPGQYDYYLLNLSWAPEFCSTLHTLTPAEQAAHGSTECTAPHGFVLHGLWPQNFDGSYPGTCATRPGPAHPEQNLDMTPDLSLLNHEWAKHGTCTTLTPDAYFATARRAYTSVKIPEPFQHVTATQMLAPDTILGMFYASNPTFPQGSFALSCGHNQLTAIEACFSREGQPMACQNIHSCRANVVKVEPQNASRLPQ